MSMQISQIMVQTTGKTDVIDVTHQVMLEVGKSNVQDGAVSLFVPGSTGALTTIEFETES